MLQDTKWKPTQTAHHHIIINHVVNQAHFMQMLQHRYIMTGDI
jgi:hypothetical protein